METQLAAGDTEITAENAFESMVEEAVAAFNIALASNKEIIKQKFELGRIAHTVIKDRKYGNNAVGKLADSISARTGKKIDRKRLYDAARLYETFEGNIGRIWELEQSWNFEVTYSFLVRQCVPAITTGTAFNAEDLKLHIENELRGMEKAAGNIERKLPQLSQLASEAEATGQFQTVEAEASVLSERVVTLAEEKAEQHVPTMEMFEDGEMSQQVNGFRVACEESPELSKFVFRQRMYQFIEFLENAANRSITLTPRDEEIVDEVIARLMSIVQRHSDRLQRQAGEM